MEKKNKDFQDMQEKLKFLDESVTEFLKMNIDERLDKIEEQLKAIKPLMKTNGEVFREDHRAMEKDKTVYLFECKSIKKKYIVLECLKHYMNETGITEAAQIIHQFPPTLRQPYGVIRPIQEVKERGWERCFHMNDILHLAGGKYVVCSAWDITNISPILDVFINELHYDIVPFENGRRKDDFSCQNE